MNETRTEAEAAKALEPLIAFAQEHKGTIKTVTDRLSEITGEPVYRQMVEKWLHADPAKRVEPRLSTGLLLLAIWDEIKPEEKHHANRRTRKPSR